ncbi:MAG: bacillithiol biosynthesis BshC [Thermoanaerobaculaceae bacterium]
MTTTIAPLAEWTSLHPAALAWADRTILAPPGGPARPARSRSLAVALAATNRRWGNPVDEDLEAWLGGAEVVVTGQQPGLVGGPLLTLVKACAVAAEVARRRAAGTPAVGFLWLATADDDLPEMRWIRVPAGEELVSVREEGWERGAALGGLAVVGDTVADLLSRLAAAYPGELPTAAIDLARECFVPGAGLGEACGRFLGRLLAGLGVVLVDALEPELARAGRQVVQRALLALAEVNEALAEGSAQFASRGWAAPIRVMAGRLPVFRREGVRRVSLPAREGHCPDEVLAAHAAAPEAFVPNVWLRPLVADEVLDTHTSILGGAELAYHLQARSDWDIVGVGRPSWRLRPHVTVVTSGDRRLVRQLGLEPPDLLRTSPPRGTLPGRSLERRLHALQARTETRLAALVEAARSELPGAVGDTEATAKRVQGSLAWLGERVHAAALRASETGAGRWRRLRAFVRPDGKPQERHLSVLAPLLRLGLDWPAQLAAALDPRHPGMQLLGWEEGGPW